MDNEETQIIEDFDHLLEIVNFQETIEEDEEKKEWLITQQWKKKVKKIANEQQEYIAIVSDRYEQEMKKAASNIKYEVENAESPYLGLDLVPIIDESLATINLSE